jgi:hypothetical protein
MYKFPTIMLFAFFLLLKGNVKAQNKYAVIVGINDYYETSTKKSVYSLKGCVNDAMSMKSLLMNRFEFESKNINLLTNQSATQENLINVLNEAITKSKAGDVVVFYYSGHGAFINNSFLNDDPIKKGYNQSLIMSNLFAKNYGCLVKDNTLKKIFNKFVEKKVILTSIFDCCFSGGMAATLVLPSETPYSDDPNYFAPASESDTLAKKVMNMDILTTGDVSFDMNADLTLNDAEKIVRPAETPNSKFATLAASKSYYKAAETWDESGVPHGAFTKALLSIYEQNKIDIPLSKVIDNINNQVSKTQLYTQSPEFQLDPNRKKTNLIGLPVETKPAKPITVNCIGTRGETIVINAGYNDGIAIGNVLTNKNKQITITRIYADSALAKSKTGLSVNTGENFILTDTYRASKPYLKIYVNTSKLITSDYIKAFNTEVLPLTKLSSYQDYNNWKGDDSSPSFLFSLNTNGEGKQALQKSMNRPFCIFLPIPADLATKIKSLLKQEQSIKLVENPTEADRVLYLNYAIDSKNKKSYFIFNYRAPVNYIGYDTFKFSSYSAYSNGLTLNHDDTVNLLSSIKEATYALVRSRTTHWINTYPRK